MVYGLIIRSAVGEQPARNGSLVRVYTPVVALPGPSPPPLFPRDTLCSGQIVRYLNRSIRVSSAEEGLLDSPS